MFLNARTRDSSTQGLYAEDTHAGRSTAMCIRISNHSPGNRLRRHFTLYIYRGTFKTAKRLLYLYVLPKRRDVGFSFRDESYFGKCSTMMVGAMKLNYCLPFLQCQSFLTIYRGVKGTRWVVSGSKGTDNIIVRWTGLCWRHHSRRRLSFSGNVEMGNELWRF